MASIAAVPACSNEPSPPDVLGSPPVEPRFERRIPRYFAGLQEQATIVKSELSIRVERADGSLQLLADVERADVAAWRERHGAADRSLVHRLATAEPSEAFQVALTFDSLGGREELALRLQSEDEEVAAAARQEHAQIIAEMGAPLQDAARELGATVLGAAKYAPFVFAEGTSEVLDAVAHEEGLSAVVHDPGGEAVDHATSPATAHAVSSFGSNTTGTNRKVGIIEPGTCLIRDTNILVDAPTTYQDTAAGVCFSSSACTSLCGLPGNLSHACVGGRCRDGHGTAVASIIGQMMPDVALYYSNKAVQPCSLQASSVAFDYFVAQGVKIVNESYSCLRSVYDEDDGALQDYHARVNGIFITRAAGNASADDAIDDTEDACRGTKNAMCVGATTSAADKRACYSVWRNPDFLTFELEDREEPDVVGFGGEHPGADHYECDGVAADQVSVAGTGSDILVTGTQGTSFAAPAVAALGSLLQEYCVERLRPAPNALTLRSWIRTAAFAANPVGWKYSTLQHVFAQGDTNREGLDHEDGGGFATATTLKKLCSTVPSDEKVIKGGGPRKAADGQPASGSPDAEPAFPDVPPGEQSLKAPLDQGLAPAPGMSGYMFDTLHTEQLAVGDRFRFTFSWDSCNVASRSDASVPTLVDFDVFLYNATRGEGLYASQTAGDVNEGFDVVIPEGWGGTYEVLLYWPTDAVFCNDSENTGWTGWIKKAAP